MLSRLFWRVANAVLSSTVPARIAHAMPDKDRLLVLRAQVEARLHGPRAGRMYAHYKGSVYIVLRCAVDEVTLKPVVVYYSVERGYCWVRKLSVWNEQVMYEGRVVPRFRPLED